ncbi:MAG: uroporphyrinogen decarboxylase family protein [Planctomycetota bacterium]|jgi:uroporphyrinogen-III decarboxylase
MGAKQRFYTALSGGVPDRVPTLAKIWVDLAANLTGTDLVEVVNDPETAMRIVVDAALSVKADGARLFHMPGRMTRMENDAVVEINKAGGVIGPVDMQGGLATRVHDKDFIKLEDVYQMAFIQFWKIDEPLVNSIEDAKKIAVPDKSFYEQQGFGKLERELLEEVGDDIALLGDCGPATLAFHIFFRDYARALMDFVENPELTHAIMEKGVAHAVEKGKFHIDNGIKMLRLNDSPANMLVISPENFREFIFPHVKEVCDELHSYDGEVRIYIHICGNIIPIMDDLVKTGLDCIGCLDPLGNFTCAEARAAVGDRAGLMGGVNTLSFIQSNPDEIIQQSRICIEGAGQKGGYILGSGCVVPRSTPKENLLALNEASKLYGTQEYLSKV